MRKLLFLATLLVAPSCFAGAQPPSPATGPSWARLQSLPSNSFLNVTAMHHKSNCALKTVTEDTLTCVAGDGAKVETYPKAEIKSVKIRQRGRSALVGLALGGGIGAAIGAPLGESGSFVGHGAAAVIIAVPGALIGLGVGLATDFTHTTVYKAP